MNSFTIEEVYKQEESKLEKLNRIKEDFKNSPDEAIKCIFNLSNALDNLGVNWHKLQKENHELNAEISAKDELIEELKAELEDLKYKLEEAKDENQDLKEQLENMPPRNYYDEIGILEEQF